MVGGFYPRRDRQLCIKWNNTVMLECYRGLASRRQRKSQTSTGAKPRQAWSFIPLFRQYPTRKDGLYLFKAIVPKLLPSSIWVLFSPKNFSRFGINGRFGLMFLLREVTNPFNITTQVPSIFTISCVIVPWWSGSKCRLKNWLDRQKVSTQWWWVTVKSHRTKLGLNIRFCQWTSHATFDSRRMLNFMYKCRHDYILSLCA